MAYSATNPPRKIADVGFLGGQCMWIYESTDVHGDVDASGYFAGVNDLGNNIGMKVGDLVIVRTTSTGATSLHSVTDVTDGDATISAIAS